MAKIAKKTTKVNDTEKVTVVEKKEATVKTESMIETKTAPAPVKKETIQFYKIREVESPTRSNDSVGIDFYIPYSITGNEIATLQSPRYDANEPRVQIKSEGVSGIISQYTVPPRARLVIPTGIKIKFPEGKSGLILNKGRVALNTGIHVMNSFIDGKTLDEIKINVVNTSDVPVNIHPGKQIAQMIVIDTPLYELEQVEMYDSFYSGVECESVSVIEPTIEKTVVAPKANRLSEEDLRRIEDEVESQFNFGDNLNTIGG